ncbi:MAG: hypothetical protein WAM30_00080, partial [Candidatus Dormiibacterota bacterium]
MRSGQPGNLFPSGIAFHAVREDANRYSATTTSLLRKGARFGAIDFVRAPKWDLSTRPAADMPVTDQLVYITIVSQLKDSVHPDLVSFT